MCPSGQASLARPSLRRFWGSKRMKAKRASGGEDDWPAWTTCSEAEDAEAKEDAKRKRLRKRQTDLEKIFQPFSSSSSVSSEFGLVS